MNQASVACPFCGKPGRRILIPAFQEGILQVTCPCLKQAPVRYVRFPALDVQSELPQAEPTRLEDDSSCYHHPDRQARAVCGDCGMFVCGLCEVKEGEASLCLSCFSKRKSSELKMAPDRSPREGQIIWDRVALLLAVLPILFVYVTVITAPMVIYIVLRYWKGHPYSIFPITRIRFVIAFLIALAQIVGWIALIFFLVTA